MLPWRVLFTLSRLAKLVCWLRVARHRCRFAGFSPTSSHGAPLLVARGEWLEG
jgi:hypothetical protein